jgi:hypothetical protein
MPLSTDIQTQPGGIVNHAVGRAVTSSATAAITTFTLGFAPRIVRFYNLTDSICDEWYEGMASASSIHTVLNGTRSLEVTNGIAVSGNTFTLTATTMVASKTYAWEAIG